MSLRLVTLRLPAWPWAGRAAHPRAGTGPCPSQLGQMPCAQHITAGMGIRIGKIFSVVASKRHLICLPSKPPLPLCPYTVPSTASCLSFPGLGENHGTNDKTLIPGHSSEKVLQHLAIKKNPSFFTLDTIRALHRHRTICPHNTNSNLASFITLLM